MSEPTIYLENSYNVFKNYQMFTGTSTIDKNQSMRITVSSQSLNYLIGTFQAPNRTNITQPINTLISPPQAGETGVYSATFDNQVDSGMPRTFNNAFIILDEAQNTTIDQMKMFLTRFGENVKVVITGDPTQSDITGENGLQWAVKKLKHCKSIAVIQYENKDVVRSALVRDILHYLEKNEKYSNDLPNSQEDTTGSLPSFITGAVDS